MGHKDNNIELGKTEFNDVWFSNLMSITALLYYVENTLALLTNNVILNWIYDAQNTIALLASFIMFL